MSLWLFFCCNYFYICFVYLANIIFKYLTLYFSSRDMDTVATTTLIFVLACTIMHGLRSLHARSRKSNKLPHEPNRFGFISESIRAWHSASELIRCYAWTDSGFQITHRTDSVFNLNRFGLSCSSLDDTPLQPWFTATLVHCFHCTTRSWFWTCFSFFHWTTTTIMFHLHFQRPQ